MKKQTKVPTMKAPRKPPAQTEAQLQRAVAKLLDASGLLWCHVPNGGNRDARTGAKLKAEGVKPGVPDVLIFEPTYHIMTRYGHACGVALELKVGKNKPNANQRAWHRLLIERGWSVAVCYSMDQVVDTLRECYPNEFKP